MTSYKVRTGDCGAAAETVDTVDKQPTAIDAPCKGSIGYTADNCAVTNDFSCPVDAVEKGAVATYSGKYDWSKDGSSGSGILDLTIVNSAGKNLCHGTYDVTVSRR